MTLLYRNAIYEWIPEFFIAKEAWGPIVKPQPQVTSKYNFFVHIFFNFIKSIKFLVVMPIIPIIPSINTCMSLTTTTTTSTNAKTVTVPEVNTTQLQALADVCCSSVNSSSMNPILNPVMNSLVSPTKVVTNDDILNPITTCAASNIELPKKIPISIVSVPIMHTKTSVDIGREHTIGPFASMALRSKEKGLNKNNVDEDNEEDMKDEESTVTRVPISSGTGAIDNSLAPTPTALNEINATNKIVEEEDITIDENNQTTSIDVNTANNNISTSSTSTLLQEGTAPIAMNAVLEDNNLSSLSPSTINEPMECSSSITSQTSPKEEELTALKLLAVGQSEDVIMAETPFQDDTNVREFNLLYFVINYIYLIYSLEYHANRERCSFTFIKFRRFNARGGYHR